MMHPDCLIRSNFRLRRSDNLHKDSHQNSWIYPRVKKAGAALVKTIASFIIVKHLPVFCRSCF